MSRPARARGLKLEQGLKVYNTIHVAPCAGAWIETPSGLMEAKMVPGRALRGRVD